jgi:hypothetical protein
VIEKAAVALAHIYFAEGAGAVGDVEMSAGPPWLPSYDPETLWSQLVDEWQALFMAHAETILKAAGALPSTGETV